MSFVIREAIAADHDELRNMIGELHDTVKVFDKDLGETEAILDAYLASLEARVASSKGAFYVAVDGDSGLYLGYPGYLTSPLQGCSLTSFSFSAWDWRGFGDSFVCFFRWVDTPPPFPHVLIAPACPF